MTMTTRPLYENPGPLDLFFDDPVADQGRFDLFFFDEVRCSDFVIQRLCARGFACPRCSRRRFAVSARSKALTCTFCRLKVWFLKDTIFHRSKLPLTTWFRAAFLLRFRGTNASNLAEMLGVAYKTSWLLCQKLRYAMGLVQQRREVDAVALGPPLRFVAHRGVETPHPHGCERLESPDFALRTPIAYPEEPTPPWQRWIAERGPLPQESLLADEVRLEISSQFQSSIGERYLQLYLDEFAFRWDRRWLGLWMFVFDLADALPLTPPRSRRELGNFPRPRRARPWLAIRE
jgi:hypothetical protein